MNVRVYLAGKIGKNDWRTELFGERPMSVYASEASEPWGDVQIPGTSDVAVGPWFIYCDHGCAHGPGQHGFNANDPDWGCISAEHGHRLDRRELTVERCLDAITRCDLFFAWLEPTAYGTVTELGYAKALGKRVAVGVHEALDLGPADDLWFARYMADEVVYAPGPAAALRHFLDNASRWSALKCESPIERMLLDRLSTKRLCGFSAFNQYVVDPYRLDFAFVRDDGRKVAVEVDGHDFHERTKEQAQRDKERDRFLTLNGWRVLRFTGSEVYQDAARCADEVVSLLERL